MMTTLFVSAQVALPEWVRGRGLAIFLTVFFGAMTVGSAVWGKVASVEGLSTALYVAAAGAAVGMILTLRWPIAGRSRARPHAFDALAHAGVRASGRGRGRADLADRRIQDRPGGRAAFLAVIHEIGLERKRDGAYAWGVFEDTQVTRPDRRDVPHPVAARTQAPAHAGDDRRPDDRGAGANVPEGAAEGRRFLVSPRRHRSKRRKRVGAAARGEAEGRAARRGRVGRPGGRLRLVNPTRSPSTPRRAPIRRSASPSDE